MSAVVADVALDKILALQFTVAWAGEGRCEPRRLGWWDTDLVDPAGGGNFFERLLPRTHRWSALAAAREAARRVDRAARGRMADPDAVRSIFFLGFDVDEQVDDRLAFLKRQGTEGKAPAEALELPLPLGAEFDRAKLAAVLASTGPEPYKTRARGPSAQGATSRGAARRRGTAGGGPRAADRQLPPAALPGGRVMPTPVAPPPPPVVAAGPAKPHEVSEVHTRLLRLALGIEESRAYWERVDPAVRLADRALRAFEERWFGGKSLERVRYLIASCSDRYDAFPSVLAVLRRWTDMDLATRQVICHWHLQLSDPLYRSFTGRHLVGRRGMGSRAQADAKIDRNGVLRWLKGEYPDRWSEATLVQFASKLLSATSEAGLLSAKRDPRALLFPKVTDLALAYFMYLLREIEFDGTLVENPYLASVGLEEGMLDQRLRNLPGLTFRRMGQLTEFEWAAPDLPLCANVA